MLDDRIRPFFVRPLAELRSILEHRERVRIDPSLVSDPFWDVIDLSDLFVE